MADSCSIHLCRNEAKALGLCTSHYWRLKRTGSPTGGQVAFFHRGKPLTDMLEERHVPEPNSGCWLWIGHINREGYGVLNLGGRSRLAHRIVYTAHKGEIPEDVALDHTCLNKQCVNPEHLEPVTHAENTRRARSLRKTCSRGHPFAGGNVRLSAGKDGYVHRVCRRCQVEAAARYRARKAARRAEVSR